MKLFNSDVNLRPIDLENWYLVLNRYIKPLKKYSSLSKYFKLDLLIELVIEKLLFIWNLVLKKIRNSFPSSGSSELYATSLP